MRASAAIEAALGAGGDEEDAIRAFARGEPLGEVEWPSKEAFATSESSVGQIYARSDADELLRGFVLPRVRLVEEDLTERLLDLPLDVVEAVSARLVNEYERARGQLVDRLRAHREMTRIQRTSLLVFFLIVVRGLVMARQRRIHPGMPDLARSTDDYVYVQQAATLGRLRLAVGDGTVPADRWTLREWRLMADSLEDALARCGAALEGARDIWGAHWDRFIGLLDSRERLVSQPSRSSASSSSQSDSESSDEEGVEEDLAPGVEEALRMTGLLPPTATKADRQAAARQMREATRASHVLTGLYDDKESTVGARHRESRKHELLYVPLPYVCGGRRISAMAVVRWESRFYAYQCRFAALSAFEQAARRDHELGLAQRPVVHRTQPHRVMERFLVWMRDRVRDTISQRYVREQIGTPMMGAHLNPGETERAVLEQLARYAWQGSNDRPQPAEVLAETRPAVYKQVDKSLENSGEFVLSVIDNYLREEAKANDTWRTIPCAPETERLAMLLLPNLLDAALSRVGVRHRSIECSWIDELRAGEHLPWITPQEAMKRVVPSIIARALIVRVLRRTFVVCVGVLGVDTPPVYTVVEVPSLSAALLVWLAWSDIELEDVPETMREEVAAIRA
jgi:hypothetical protein